ncbi:MAG: hemerythrin domain-containing protein [Spirochaetales bacterium]|nr:hemerythrin domain-containing protein [Spirochaetales bacterium]
MKPRGVLMIEHRLIEKMLDVTVMELDRIIKERKADPGFIDVVVDFIRTYADRTHHGKEEDILFKALSDKQMDEDDDKMMRELVDEHKRARQAVKELVEAKNRYAGGDETSIDDITEKIGFLVGFYPEHIRKEDDVFFPNTEKYFTGSELESMLEKFWEFDRKMIHEKYNGIYESLRNSRGSFKGDS